MPALAKAQAVFAMFCEVADSVRRGAGDRSNESLSSDARRREGPGRVRHVLRVEVGDSVDGTASDRFEECLSPDARRREGPDRVGHGLPIKFADSPPVSTLIASKSRRSMNSVFAKPQAMLATSIALNSTIRRPHSTASGWSLPSDRQRCPPKFPACGCRRSSSIKLDSGVAFLAAICFPQAIC
eukprot:CAMPEP_0118915906 /NCGR_PEP_ID=MMETSP1166-20130328/16016_1 /TAXON_ID=1104430 /ORGANISM="Chrysoreinhardia sp, Strain CCMP3193" /LENGTH=183 /DNA_ID=CAMNT_0006855675 /DNA_START=746 /DNA_END=1300 /DNA_ORIENTATION=-